MRIMGLEAICPKPRLSFNGGAHLRFPYLLRGLAIECRLTRVGAQVIIGPLVG
jgi:hypothetical protein